MRKSLGSLEFAPREACEKFVQYREREGEHLKNDLITKLRLWMRR